MTHLALKNGSRVAVIGGGPAGAFSAYFLKKYSMACGLDLQITIFDGKDFLQDGPRGCNLCAGVIAENLYHALKREGIVLPEERILSRLDGYVLHSGEERLVLTAENGSRGRIATVFRGNGPRYSQFPDAISFDDYLLSFVRDFGAEVISQQIADIRFSADPSRPLQLQTQNAGNNVFEADLVVGAFGVNTRLAEQVEKMGFGYQRPATLLTYQTEIKLPSKRIPHELERKIHVYLLISRILRYVTLTPKGDFVTLTAVGHKGLDPKKYPLAVHNAIFSGSMPEERVQCACFPRIVTSSAVRPFADRMVMVGDAGYSRYYKNGIESAFITARLAAEAAVYRGVDAGSFAHFYHRSAHRIISRDNEYGRFLFFSNDIVSRLPLFRKIPVRLADPKNLSRSSRKFRWILWNMFTGNAPYKKIFLAVFDPGLQASILKESLKIVIDRLKKLLK